jgi:DNA-binding MarR family transcriptional regulator
MTASSASDIQVTESALPEELLASTGFLLSRVGMGMKLRVLEELDDAGCPGFQYGVLALLREGASQTQARIADVLGVDRSQLVGELDELEERGLIERRRDPEDRRRHMVKITAAGKRELVRLRAIVRRLEDSYLACLDEASRKQLHDLLLDVAACNDSRYKR